MFWVKPVNNILCPTFFSLDLRQLGAGDSENVYSRFYQPGAEREKQQIVDDILLD